MSSQNHVMPGSPESEKHFLILRSMNLRFSSRRARARASYEARTCTSYVHTARRWKVGPGEQRPCAPVPPHLHSALFWAGLIILSFLPSSLLPPSPFRPHARMVGQEGRWGGSTGALAARRVRGTAPRDMVCRQVDTAGRRVR